MPKASSHQVAPPALQNARSRQTRRIRLHIHQITGLPISPIVRLLRDHYHGSCSDSIRRQAIEDCIGLKVSRHPRLIVWPRADLLKQLAAFLDDMDINQLFPLLCRIKIPSTR